MEKRYYIAIDLKSYYASVECVERGLDPLKAYLVVADKSRTDKTICLAVSPALKALGIPGRPRLFEVVQRVGEINRERERLAALQHRKFVPLEYITAPPRMSYYIEYSSKIFGIYMKYVSPEDIHVYSVDEAFIDATPYLGAYNMTARELAMTMIKDVLDTTGITATAGIGTNLYLCKVAMDIVAKHIPADENGVRIAELDEMSYREKLWEHRPLTDFWRVGRGYEKKLEENGLYTMGDIARCSLGGNDELYNSKLLYKLFGVNAELLIDHAWGREPVTIADIKAYRPASSSLSTGQVLHKPYTFEKGLLIVKEMTDLLVLDIVDKGLVTTGLTLTIGYDTENLADPERLKSYKGKKVYDYYGRAVPKHAHGTVRPERPTSSTRDIMRAITELYIKIVDPELLIRRVNISAENLIAVTDVEAGSEYEQTDLFVDYEAQKARRERDELFLNKERFRQKALLSIQKKYGRNAILKGMNFEEDARTRERNGEIGGHKA